MCSKPGTADASGDAGSKRYFFFGGFDDVDCGGDADAGGVDYDCDGNCYDSILHLHVM